MNRWAAQGLWDANFLCICVMMSGARQLAAAMGKEMRLTHCVNAFVEQERDMPQYGQLGCSGFIVLDNEHRVVSAKTSSLSVGKDLAFAHVETLLRCLLDPAGPRPPPRICPGEFVELVNHHDRSPVPDPKTGAPQRGICVGLDDAKKPGTKRADEGLFLLVSFVDASGRPQKPRKVSLQNVRKLSEEEMDDEESDEEEMSDEGDEEPSTRTGSCGGGGGACGGGGGTCNGCTTKGTGAAAPALSGVASVGVPEMDEEHEECTHALNALAATRSRDALRGVLSCFQEHFRHEEELMEQTKFGEHVNAALSARKTHMEDHARILELLRRELKQREPQVSAAFVDTVLREFVEHAERYDSQYGHHINAAQDQDRASTQLDKAAVGVGLMKDFL